MSVIGKEEKGGTCGKATKGAPIEGAGMLCKDKSAERRKEVEESRGRRGSAHGQAIRSVARIEEELSRGAKEESRGTLWKRHSGRSAIIRVRVNNGRDSSIILDLQVWRKGVSHKRQLRARGDPLMEVERVELVWMQRESRGEGSVAQRGKGTARQHIVGRTRKYSKREG